MYYLYLHLTVDIWKDIFRASILLNTYLLQFYRLVFALSSSNVSGSELCPQSHHESNGISVCYTAIMEKAHENKNLLDKIAGPIPAGQLYHLHIRPL